MTNVTDHASVFGEKIGCEELTSIRLEQADDHPFVSMVD
jgi:hypothetical protein